MCSSDLSEPAEDRAALFTFEVDREAALVAIESREVPAFAGGERLEKAREVAGRRMLDLDDVGAESRKDLRAVRAGQRARQIEHPDALEGVKARQAVHATDQACRCAARIVAR